jgi:hypothetical protein
MIRKLLLAALLLLFSGSVARANDDIGPAYGIGGTGNRTDKFVSQVVIGCASHDGSVTAAPCGTAQNPIYVTISGGTINSPSVTPAAPSGSLILTAGGTAQPFAGAGTANHGCTIVNPSTAALQGLSAAETAWIDITGAAAVQAAGATSIPLLPGASFSCPPGMTTGISWNAATTGHKLAGEVH